MGKRRWEQIAEEVKKMPRAACRHRCLCVCHHPNRPLDIGSVCGGACRSGSGCVACGLGHVRVRADALAAHLKECHGGQGIGGDV